MTDSAFIPAHQLPATARASEEAMLDYALSLLDEAASFAVTPISKFNVGAIAIDSSGNFYFGANQEYARAPIGQTVHAEQSAISHALARGAKDVKHIVVNHTPCGHCRQFMTELASAETLQIHLPHALHNLLGSYLPDSFGPADLEIPERLFTPHDNQLPKPGTTDNLALLAWTAANRSHAPYSKAYAGVALQDSEGDTYLGWYLENAAFNPSLPPLQMALNGVHLARKTAADIVRAALVGIPEKGHREQALMLWQTLSHVPLEKHCLIVK